ncbi:MAG: cytochrome c peroxidase [Pseudomonadota bacterium]
MIERRRSCWRGAFALAGLLLAAASSANSAGGDVSSPGGPRFSPVTDADFHNEAQYADELIELGRLLFFDPILSGNRNIACATCHHPKFNSGDGVALPIGEGGHGLGPDRRVAPESPLAARVPRNSQALFFVGAKEFTTLFHDGRLERDPAVQWDSGFWSPAREQLPAGLDNIVAAQAMFPVVSPDEMAGQKGENPIADAVARDELAGPQGAWALIAARVAAIPEYVARFETAYTHVTTAADIRFTDIANAIAAFETLAFRADGSPFDEYLRTGDTAAMGASAERGMVLFYGDAGCGTCHAGKLQTDHAFHAIAMPQIGPGKGDGTDPGYWESSGYGARLEDHGRERVTHRPEDRYRFRTPSLRNVALTAPYGHAGSFATLEDVVRHHLGAEQSLRNYRNYRQPPGLLPPVSGWVEQTAAGSRLTYQRVPEERRADFEARDSWVASSERLTGKIAAANELEPVVLSDTQFADLIAFLEALSDPRSADAVHLVPDSVPSGLSVEK